MSDDSRSAGGDVRPEEWRSVIGFGEELYEVSSAGRVRRVETGRVLKPQEAAARGLMGPGRALRGEENPRAKLTEGDVREMRRLFDSGEATRRGLANCFGVTWEQVNNIVRRRSWKEVA